MKIRLSQYATKLLENLKDFLQAEDSDVVEEAIIQLYESYVKKGQIKEKRQPSSLIDALSSEGLLKRHYKCARNALPETQEEIFIEAETEENAWEQMASRFPAEIDQGFTIKEVQPFNFLD